MQFTNRLAGETSPYLLQHAHNPVDWYPWGDEALQKARNENKPILVSIGYAACHWCHVMERESFENEDTARVMNEHFVNIKIDREERPDLDHIYMDAVQAISGSGGWPLNVFLTPDLKPFYGGTYFPPIRAFNRASWTEVLNSIATIFRDKRHEIDSQAENLTQHLQQANDFGIRKENNNFEEVFSRENTETAFKALMNAADKKEGGFGQAPKFPQTFSIQYLLHYYYYTKNQLALDQACLSLDKMINGGIYDQIGGGFARYSTDAIWLAPHFEKMLYDNALLIIVLAEAYQVTGKELYKKVISDTIKFIEREMLSPERGFYSALDADSEGVEGKFYVWSKEEIERILRDDAKLYSEYYGITKTGNWEHTNILHVSGDRSVFATAHGLSEVELEEFLRTNSEKLLAERSKRIRPALDDKILLGWNALMNTAYSKAYQAFGDENYKEQAIANMDFLLNRFKKNERELFHTYKNGVAKYPAFLDDYAFLIQSLIHLQEITGNGDYLVTARKLAELVIEKFGEEESGFFFYTALDQKDILVRKKELYDGAVPSGNAIMAWNLYYLGVVFDLPSWKERPIKLYSSIYNVIVKYPTSFGAWATHLLGLANGIPEIALTGKDVYKPLKDFLRTFIASRIFQSATQETKGFPLLADKKVDEPPLFYLCKNYSCQQPVTELNALIRTLENI